jgi:hypothetical protein
MVRSVIERAPPALSAATASAIARISDARVAAASGKMPTGVASFRRTSITSRVWSHIGAAVTSALARSTTTQASSAGTTRIAASRAPRQRNVPDTPASERVRLRMSSVAGTAALTSPDARRGSHFWRSASSPVSTMVCAADKVAI